MSEVERIAEKKAELDALRPLSGQSLAALNSWYDVELTYTSNALEGNTLTRNETAIILEKGITVSGKSLKDHLEATGHKEALAYVRELAKDQAPIREIDIRNIHRLVLQKIEPDEAGRYSNHQRLIAGSTLLLPSPAEIPARMGDFARWLEKAPPIPTTAFDAHEGLVTIHPFSDGNGRTARLLMNLLLLKGGYPPVVIRPEDRPAYHDSLEAVQIARDRAGYHCFMATRLEAGLDHYLEILQRGLDAGPGNLPIIRANEWTRFMGVPQTPAVTSTPELKSQLEHPSAEIIWARAIEVFGDEVKAQAWMNQPRPIFNNRSPQQLANGGNPVEQRAVLESLIAIDYGLFS